MTAIPWEDPELLDAAMDAACQVRDVHPDDLRATLAKIPKGVLADLAIVLAAMVDVDAPRQAVMRWTHDGFVGFREREALTCSRGHSLIGANAVANGRTPGGRQRWRCGTCNRERMRGAA